jgi:NOL1/NOP2/fmu family ribosome biogenesis protein
LAEDPDIGLELTPYAKKRLHSAKKNFSKRGISLAEARKKYY